MQRPHADMEAQDKGRDKLYKNLYLQRPVLAKAEHSLQLGARYKCALTATAHRLRSGYSLSSVLDTHPNASSMPARASSPSPLPAPNNARSSAGDPSCMRSAMNLHTCSRSTGQHSELQVDENAYRVLEYVSLEWPSQTVDVVGDTALLATNAAGGGGSVVRMGLADTAGLARMERLRLEQTRVDRDYNRLRAGACVLCIADDCLDVLDGTLVRRARVAGAFAHGLDAGDGRAYCGARGGALVVIDLAGGRASERSVHRGAVESVDVSGEMVFTASCDGTVCVTDMRAHKPVLVRELGCEANAVAFNGAGLLVCGGDSGSLWVVDMRVPDVAEEIAWHRSPVCSVRWRDADVFVSCSDEQVVLWDVSFADEWEYHRYLSFVHQGQRYYKEAAFGADGVVLTTSYDGVCIFAPVE
ncbi:UNVERIFIED_CONTAM: hypothetical protein PYX00_011016 [Menopon gallinae]|uniref:Uncharacterized protein n=1 Tax=Menopon gallinae TaxID=328185 RepID=A0AAW2H6N7_9NEOP